MKHAAVLITSFISVATAMPAYAQSSDWTGFYAGGQFGTLDVDTTLPLTDFLPADEIVGEGFELGDTIAVEIDGTTYGAHAGYMYDAGSYVLGAEIDFDNVNFDEVSATFQGVSFSENVDDETDDSIIRMKFRAGYDAGKFLPYVTVGAARLDSDDENTSGTFYGAGVAFLAVDNFLIGGEILKHQFDDVFGSGFDFEATTMSLRASYKF
jgi:outer membrane immunogenic protein